MNAGDVRAQLVAATQAADLARWRGKAIDRLLIGAVLAHLPGIVAWLLGHGPSIDSWPGAILLAAYLVATGAAFTRRVDRRRRVTVFLAAFYVFLAYVNVVAPRGPYAQVGLVLMPVFALVLAGAGGAAWTVLGSVAVFGAGALLRDIPSVALALRIDPAQQLAPGAVAMQATVLGAWLVATMILAMRFKAYLVDSVAAQNATAATLASEAAARSAAQRELEAEVHERRRLEQEIAAIGDVERRKLGQELHDGVCQQVTAALLRCRAMERRLERGETVSSRDLAPLSSLLAESIDDAHDVARGLCPVDTDPDALAAAMRALCGRTQALTGVRCEFVASGDVRVPDAASAHHLYRVAQEALSNATRHGNPREVVLRLAGLDDEIVVQADDDGVGMPETRAGTGMGLHTMRSRARAMGGALCVEPAPGGGTRVTCRVRRASGAPAAVAHADAAR